MLGVLAGPLPAAANGGPGAEAAAAPVRRAGHDRVREHIRRREATRDEVLEALGSDSVETLAATLQDLHTMGSTPWVAHLLRTLWGQELRSQPRLNWGLLSAPAARAALAATLARLEPAARDRYLPELRAALADPEPFVRLQAALGLGYSGSDEDVPALMDLARHGGAEDAAGAIRALGRLTTPVARAGLATLAEEEGLNPRRRALAGRTLAAARVP